MFSLTIIRFLGFDTLFLLYNVPVSIAFVLWLFERVERRATFSRAQIALDIPVIALAATRFVYAVPFISGHGVFLTYAIITAWARSVRLAAVLILIQVLVFKLGIFQDLTVFGGMLVGAAAGATHRFLGRKRQA